jgi:hypothetical protein
MNAKFVSEIEDEQIKQLEQLVEMEKELISSFDLSDVNELIKNRDVERLKALFPNSKTKEAISLTFKDEI